MSVRFVRARGGDEEAPSFGEVADLYSDLSAPGAPSSADDDDDVIVDVEVIRAPEKRKRREPESAGKVRPKKMVPVKTCELLRAAQDGDVPAVLSCLRRGADPDARDLFGWTALMCAVQAGRRDVVRALVDVGRVDVHVRNSQGRTAFDMALLNRRSDMIEDLVRGGKGRGKRREFLVPKTEPVSPPDRTEPEKECASCGEGGIPAEMWVRHQASVHHQVAAAGSRGLREGMSSFRPPFAISEANPGYRMLLRYGWDEHSGLGKHGTGIKAPLKVARKVDRRGLGEKRRAREHLGEGGDLPDSGTKEATKLRRVITRRIHCEKMKERELRSMLSADL